jgi:NDP-sugar pyrophosphorylase family protein
MKAVVLAAGFGNRLNPLTNSIPKPMLRICGKPIIQHIVDDLVNSGFDTICIVVGYLSEQIIDYFHLQSHNAKITFVIQKQIQGTADALLQAQNFVDDDNFLLYLSDTFISENLQNITSKMLSDDSDISILSSYVSDNKISSTGTILLDGDVVLEILEKQEHSPSNIAWAGVAFFHDCTIFDKIQEKITTTKNLEITEILNHDIKNGLKIKNYLCSEFIDAGTPEGLFEVSKFLLTKFFTTTCPPSAKLFNPIFISNSSTVGKNCEIGPCVIIEDNCTVGDNVKLSNCIIFPQSKIPENNVIRNHIISKDNNLAIGNK